MAQNRRHSIRREALLDALNASAEHPSAEMLYHALKPSFPDLSLGTVYRNLTQLREHGQHHALASAAAAELGFEVRSQEHVLRGLCTDCRN